MTFSRERVKNAFSRSASSYDDAAILQKEILARLIDKLGMLRTETMRSLLDVGSGTGLACKPLSEMFGQENYYAYDFALPMLELAQHSISVPQHAVCGDASALPYQENSFDVVFSASTYQWCNDIQNAFCDSLRVLKQEGLFLFSTFGPETLLELRHCFTSTGSGNHVSSFIDMQVLGDQLLATGFESPVIESETIIVEYSSPVRLLRDLQATGATNHLQNRARGLMGKSRLNRVLGEYDSFILRNGKYPASYEVIYGHGWKQHRAEKPRPGAAGPEWQPLRFRPGNPC